MTDFVLLAIADADGRLLLQERDEHTPVAPDRWSLPGGGLEPGEEPAAAAARELAEETGVTGLDLVDLGRHRFWFAEWDGGRWAEYALFGAATGLTDDEVECHEGRQIRFVAPRDTAALDLTTSTLHALPTVLGSAPYAEAHEPGPGRRFASVMLVDDLGRVLLQERDEHARIDPGLWGLCGGHLEPGEAPLAGAVRELEEETGVRLAEGDLVHVGTFALFHADNESVDEADVYAARVPLTDADIDCREGRQIVFVAPDEALRLSLTVNAKQSLPAFLSSPLYASMTG